MKDEPVSNPFLEPGWRRELTPEEQLQLRAWLAAHPEAEGDWELEKGLNEAMGHLRDMPVPSNFTAIVLQGVASEDRAPRHSSWRSTRWWLAWLPRVAVAGLLVAGTLFGIQHHKRMEYAQSLAAISRIASLPNPSALENFDTILALDQEPSADEELLKAF